MEEKTLDRVRAYKKRPTTVAAQEFFGSERGFHSLPYRVQTLVDVLKEWVRDDVLLKSRTCL